MISTVLTNVGGTLYFTIFDKIFNELRLMRFEGSWPSMLVYWRLPSLGPFDFKRRDRSGKWYDVSASRCLPQEGQSASSPLETVRDDITLISGLTNVSGNLYFTASTPANGRELWRSDGTAIGTTMVRDITVGSKFSNLSNLTNVAGILYFSKDEVMPNFVEKQCYLQRYHPSENVGLSDQRHAIRQCRRHALLFSRCGLFELVAVAQHWYSSCTVQLKEVRPPAPMHRS